MCLRQMGLKAESLQGNGCPPIEIHGGHPPGGTLTLAGDKSSQYLTSLLLCAPYFESDTTITMQGELGAAPGGSVSFTMLDTIVTEIPGLDTKESTLSGLVRVLNKSDETMLPVKTNGDVFLTLLAHWPAVREHTSAKTLAEVFANERDDHILVPDHVLRAVAKVTEQSAE